MESRQNCPRFAAPLGGIVARTASTAELWQAHGLVCALIPGPLRGKNGYVRMPEPHRSRKLFYDDISYNEVEVHGGLTYGMDEGGWVGFDTLHLGDTWLPDSPDEPESPYERVNREVGIGPEPISEYTTVWTTEKLRAEVEDLAAQLAHWSKRHYDFEGKETPAEHHERTRKQMREFGRLRESGVDTDEALRRAYGDDDE